MSTLGSLGIAKLDLNAQSSSVKDNGNWVGLTSGYETVDGATHAMADVWFVAKDLRSQVSGLVQAIASFGSSQPGTAASGSPTINLVSGGTSTASLAVSANVGGIVDMLKQFDANGNPIGTAGILQASPTTGQTLNLSNAQDTTNTTLLVSGG